ncbi:MAG: pyrroline-5-carboxylate reductase [Desulfovibrionales bacterium]|nr:pyrroline-5-carboxylate reductase [Desulfovibrionales bacterium]
MSVKIGFIGAGNMGGAMIAGLAPAKDIKIYACDPDQDKLEKLSHDHGVIPLSEALKVAEKCDYIFYAVKPVILESIVKQTNPALDKSKCLISIAAGIPITKISAWSGNQFPVVRVMPNTPALIGRGVFAVCFDNALVSPTQKGFIIEIFTKLGRTFVLEEKSFDLFTALVGSGPAYVYYFMESMIDAGVLMGMDRKNATEMVRELFAGSSEMSIQLGKHVTELKEMVTSPGGTTITGLCALEKNGVKASIMEAVEKATRKSIDMGK